MGIYVDRIERDGEMQIGNGHFYVDKNYMLPMKLNLDYKNGDNIFRYAPTDPQWWITGFNPDYKTRTFVEKDLYATAEVDFSNNPELWEAFFTKYKNNEDYDVRIYTAEKKAVLKW